MQIRGQRSVYTSGGPNDPLIILDGMIFMVSFQRSTWMILDKLMISGMLPAAWFMVQEQQQVKIVIIITTKKENKVFPL